MTASNDTVPTSTKAPQATSDLPLDPAGEHPMMTGQAENKPILFQGFATGKIVMTRGLHTAMEDQSIDYTPFLLRHLCGDWGEVCEEDWAANNEAVTSEGRLLSAYTLPENPEAEKLWIITEWDRSVTTLLLPSKY